MLLKLAKIRNSKGKEIVAQSTEVRCNLQRDDTAKILCCTVSIWCDNIWLCAG